MDQKEAQRDLLLKAENDVDSPQNESEIRETDDLELRGLLSGVTTRGHVDEAERGGRCWRWLAEGSRNQWSVKGMTYVGAALILFVLGASLSRPFLGFACKDVKGDHPNSKFVGSELRSNGTADFKRTVLIVSIDGLRYASSVTEVKLSNGTLLERTIWIEVLRRTYWTSARKGCVLSS